MEINFQKTLVRQDSQLLLIFGNLKVIVYQLQIIMM